MNQWWASSAIRIKEWTTSNTIYIFRSDGLAVSESLLPFFFFVLTEQVGVAPIPHAYFSGAIRISAADLARYAMTNSQVEGCHKALALFTRFNETLHRTSPLVISHRWLTRRRNRKKLKALSDSNFLKTMVFPCSHLSFPPKGPSWQHTMAPPPGFFYFSFEFFFPCYCKFALSPPCLERTATTANFTTATAPIMFYPATPAATILCHNYLNIYYGYF